MICIVFSPGHPAELVVGKGGLGAVRVGLLHQAVMEIVVESDGLSGPCGRQDLVPGAVVTERLETGVGVGDYDRLVKLVVGEVGLVAPGVGQLGPVAGIVVLVLDGMVLGVGLGDQPAVGVVGHRGHVAVGVGPGQGVAEQVIAEPSFVVERIDGPDQAVECVVFILDRRLQAGPDGLYLRLLGLSMRMTHIILRMNS